MCISVAADKAGPVRHDSQSTRCFGVAAKKDPITKTCPIKAQPGWAQRRQVREKSLVLVLFYCYSHWDNEIIEIFFFLMRMRQNTLVPKRWKKTSIWGSSLWGKIKHSERKDFFFPKVTQLFIGKATNSQPNIWPQNQNNDTSFVSCYTKPRVHEGRTALTHTGISLKGF